MRRRIEIWIGSLCWAGRWYSPLLCRVWFRWYCPYPIIDDLTARACVRAGHCGCNNAASYKTA